MYCRRCGVELPEGSAFCPRCGTAVAASTERGAQPTTADTWESGQQAAGHPRLLSGGQDHAGPTGMEALDTASQGSTAPSTPAPSRKRTALLWIAGGGGLLAVIALVLVLVLLVFGGGRAGASSPEETVRSFFQALESKDAEALLEVMEPSFRERLEGALGDRGDDFFDLFFASVPDDLRVDIRNMATETRGDRATVTVTDGTMAYTDAEGKKVVEEASEAEESSFQLVRVRGRWYLSGEFLADMGFDPGALDYLDLLDELDTDGVGPDSLDLDDGLSGDELLAEVEAAMLGYVYANSEAGLEYAITGLLVEGDQAVGIAVCLNQELENVPVVMRRGLSGWYGTGFGSGEELPGWFLAEMAEVEEVMLDHAYLNSAGEMTLEITNLAVRNGEAAARVVSPGGEVEDAAITARKGNRGWYVVDFGTGIELPTWYWPQAYW